jgi:hypothetical protein
MKQEFDKSESKLVHGGKEARGCVGEQTMLNIDTVQFSVSIYQYHLFKITQPTKTYTCFWIIDIFVPCRSRPTLVHLYRRDTLLG